MKKLMIAAAAAAMIGGVQATELAYDYTATLKTTVGKGGSTTTTTCNLGQNQTGTAFWYDDPTITPTGDPLTDYYTIVAYKDQADGNKTKYAMVDLAGNEIEKPIFSFEVTDLKTKSGVFGNFVSGGDTYYAVVSFTANKYGYIGKLNSNFNALSDAQKGIFATALENTYNKKSAGKWCATFKYKDLVQCYRVAGSRKVTGRVTVQDCCTDQYQGQDADENPIAISFDLFNRFGAITFAKATKIEVCGNVNGYCDGVTATQFSLAGQGTWAKLATDSNKDPVEGISSVSGNIVGVLDDPDCESCCQANVLATAWTCDGTENGDINHILTAAYGTWTLKFNKKASTID